ncbi:MAG: ABC transporter ATP-binding protein [Microthrixaceae bacterium]
MLEIEDVSRTYRPPRGLLRALLRSASTRDVRALSGVSIDAPAGRIHGLVGPNGAGKTTLIRIISGLLTADEGQVRVAGVDPTGNRRRIGSVLGLVLADDRSLYWRLTGRQNLEFHGVLHGLDRATAAKRAGELLEQFDLAGSDRLVFGYSTGMRARLGIARALVHDPAVVLLDEPTRSLDPVSALEVCDRLSELANDGHTVVLSSHRLDELERIAHDVSVIISGRVEYSGPTSDLRTTGSSVAESLEMMLVEDRSRALRELGVDQ